MFVAVFLSTAIAHIEIRTFVAMPTRSRRDFTHAVIATVAILGKIGVETMIKRHHGAVRGSTKLQ